MGTVDVYASAITNVMYDEAEDRFRQAGITVMEAQNNVIILKAGLCSEPIKDYLCAVDDVIARIKADRAKPWYRMRLLLRDLRRRCSKEGLRRRYRYVKE